MKEYFDIQVDVNGMETEMHNSYGRKTQYPAIQQPQSWQPHNIRKHRYHDVPTYPADQMAHQMNNNSFGNDPRRTVSSTEITTKNDFKLGKKFDLITWFKRHPMVVMLFSYFCIFVIGITIGLVPFVTMYMESCKEDKRFLEDFRKIIERQRNLTSLPMTSAVSSGSKEHGGATGVGNTDILSYIQSLGPKTAIGTGNKDIALECTGMIHILSIRHNGVIAAEDTLSLVRKYCENNLSVVNNRNHCDMSLKRVYENEYPLDTVTEVYYKCY